MITTSPYVGPTDADTSASVEYDERFPAHVLADGTYQRIGALNGDRVRTDAPLAVEFTLAELSRP